MSNNYALITGASRGLGKELARELASRNFNLVLVALPGEGLEDLCSQMAEKYDIKTGFYETDLSQKQNIMKMTSWVNENFMISVLINNVGAGGPGNLPIPQSIILISWFSSISGLLFLLLTNCFLTYLNNPWLISLM
jgi:short-subunit dehydrogenase